MSGYDSEGFLLSKNLLSERLFKGRVSKGVVDTSQVPQCEFPLLQHLPLSFYDNFFAGQSLNSFEVLMLRALKYEDDFARLLCFSV